MKLTTRQVPLFLLLLILLFSVLPAPVVGEESPSEEIVDEVLLDSDPVETDGEETGSTARDALIDDIIDLGESLYKKANGKSQRAHYKSDIYICKNFTVYLFRQNRDKYRMAEYPDVPLVIPDNLPSSECKPYSCGRIFLPIKAIRSTKPLSSAMTRASAKRITWSWLLPSCGK